MALVKGENFNTYQSAIVQGIKRSGKTSLLNYFREHIKANKNFNTISIYVDCQEFSSESPQIYGVFFKSVLNELPLQYPDVTDNLKWENFSKKWTNDEISIDENPRNISLFYRELKQILGNKGIFLIIDEFDKLLERLKNKNESIFENLLGALRSIQMNQECFSAVHLLLCGSNKLLTFNREGSYLNQMFQSYSIIPIGQMLIKDIEEMIRGLTEKQDSPIRFNRATFGWIERYTAGLVWYTRLLVNEIIKKVLSANRNCAYPSDVCDAFYSICIETNCKQFTDGCTSNDLAVIDALQSLADRYGKYISSDELAALLKNKLNAEQLEQSLSILTDTLELFEKHPTSKMYQFRVEIYRRYLRSKKSTLTLGDQFTTKEISIKTNDSDSMVD